MSVPAPALKIVVGGPEERRDAEVLQHAFARCHQLVHEIKQTEPELDRMFGELMETLRVLGAHGCPMRPQFGGPMQTAFDRWKQLRPSAPLEVPAFVNREPQA